jgi:DNA repair exonuclease SbcCD ATPase subunit
MCAVERFTIKYTCGVRSIYSLSRGKTAVYRLVVRLALRWKR